MNLLSKQNISFASMEIEKKKIIRKGITSVARLTFAEFKSSFIAQSRREKCLSTELFLVRIFLYSVRIQEYTDQK